jgi:putative peptidoglycan lipid II flippase
MQNYKKLIGSISIVTFSYAASRGLGFFREILLAKWVGVTQFADTLDLAFIIPDFLFYLSAGGYLAITLIPLMSSKKESELNEYFLSLLYGLSVVFVTFSLIIYSFRNKFAEFLGVESIKYFNEIFTPVIFSQVFFFIGAMLMSYQYLKEKFIYTAFAPVVYNASIILFGWINSSTPENTVRGFAIGTLVGSIAGHLILQIIGASKSGLKFNLTSPKFKYVKEYLFVSFPLVVGQSIAVVDEQLYRIFGSILSAGSVASFRYARRIALLPVGVIAQAIGVASYPLLAKLYRNKNFKELNLLIRKQLVYLFTVNGAIMVFCISNSKFLIELIYERGAFSTQDTIRVSSVFSIVALAIVPWSINQILTRSFYIQKKYWFPVASGSLITFTAVVLLIMTGNKTAEEYAIVITFSLFLYSLILLFTVKFDETKVLNKPMLLDLSKAFMILLIIYFLINQLFTTAGIISALISLLIIFLISYASIHLLKFEYINITKRR